MSAMNVMTFKVLNGDELIADVTFVGDGFLHVDNVMILQMAQHPETGKVSKFFADWPALAEPAQSHRIPLTAIMCMPSKAHEELERNYVANITGLELPPVQPKILLG